MSKDSEVESLRNNFRNLILVLRYFAAKGQFHYLDRLSSAMDPSVVRQTIYEALRSLRAAINSAIKIEMEAEGKKKEEVICLDYDVFYSEDEMKRSAEYLLANQFKDVVKVGKVISAPRSRSDLVDKYIICYTLASAKEGTLPWPSEKEVSEFLKRVEKKGVYIAHILASLAVSGYGRR